MLIALMAGMMQQQQSATAMMESSTVVAAPGEKRWQTRGDGRQVSAVAMMKAEGNSCGSRQLVKGGERGQQRRR